MIEIYLKTEHDNEFNPIANYCLGCFVYVKQASLEDLDQIDQLVSHEIGDIHGSIDKYEIPRVEQHGDNLILFTRHPGEQEVGLHAEPLTLILTKKYLIAISPYSNPLINHMLLSNIDIPTTNRSMLLLYLLARISHQFTTSIKQVRHSILLHEQPTRMIDSDAIIALTKNEETLNQYLTALVSMRNLLEALATHNYLELADKDREQLQEQVIAITQSEELCHVNVKSIRSLRDSYQIIFTNDVNKTIKRLTAITIILSIPTMIASIYGMNVAVPFKDYPHAFMIILSTAGVFSLFAMLLFIKNRWL
ncbi:MAG: mg2 transporter protein CorA family protein [Parachlamydiales bacterium]|nr:mg2 transporter protein CorA family protein [Parachlamydiales bacterium]